MVVAKALIFGLLFDFSVYGIFHQYLVLNSGYRLQKCNIALEEFSLFLLAKENKLFLKPFFIKLLTGDRVCKKKLIPRDN